MSRKAKFEEVKESREAVAFHRNRFENGSRDKLALQCYQLKMQEEIDVKKINSTKMD